MIATSSPDLMQLLWWFRNIDLHAHVSEMKNKQEYESMNHMSEMYVYVIDH